MTVTLKDAQAQLAELIAKLAPGEEIVITQDEKPVARLRGEQSPARQPRVPGSAKEMIAYMADDFDAPLDLVEKAIPNSQFGRCKGKLVILAEDDEHLKDFDDYMPPKEN